METSTDKTKLKQNPLTCSGHTRPVVQLQFSPIINEKYYLISACKDGKPILRDGKTGDWLGTFLGHKGAVWCANLSKDAKLAVTGSADFTAKLWNAVTGEELSTYSHQHIVRSCCFDSLGEKIVTGGQEKQIRLFDIKNGDKQGLLFPKVETNIKYLQWDNQKNLLFSSGEESFIRVWDPRTMTEVKRLDTKSNISSMGISMDESILQCSAGKQAIFWDINNLELIKEMDFKFDVSSVSISPNKKDKLIVGGISDLWVHTFDFNTGEELEVYKGHHGPVHSVSYSPDGEIYASGSEDGTIRLWQNEPGKPYGLWQLKTESEVQS
ncbi:WD40 repeat-like protein [Neoconidiobolus thromboides FSU 785]|nr:WD40 repeat-like protein [Neoconidiobolus thromboides FSU 785]